MNCLVSCSLASWECLVHLKIWHPKRNIGIFFCYCLWLASLICRPLGTEPERFSSDRMLIRWEWDPHNKRRSGHRHAHRGEGACADSEDTAVCMPRREVSGGTSPGHTWVSDSSLQDWGRHYSLLLLQPLPPQYFVMETQAEEYNQVQPYQCCLINNLTLTWNKKKKKQRERKWHFLNWNIYFFTLNDANGLNKTGMKNYYCSCYVKFKFISLNSWSQKILQNTYSHSQL